MSNKAIFLDRDGTINVEKNYLYKIEDFEFLPGVIPALRSFQEAGYRLIIITNQSGIARGYYEENDFRVLNDWLIQELGKHGIIIDRIYYCPHHPNAKIKKYRVECNCRKPKLGLFKKATEEFDLDIDKCFAIGDKLRDCAICESTNCHGFLIGENESKENIQRAKVGDIRNVSYASNLLCAAREITGKK